MLPVYFGSRGAKIIKSVAKICQSYIDLLPRFYGSQCIVINVLNGSQLTRKKFISGVRTSLK